MKSVLLALSCEDFSEQVADTILKSKHFRLAGICHNGADAIAMLILHCPEILVIDLSLPRENGLSVLNAAKKMKHPPTCLVLTREMNPTLSEALLRLDIDDVLLQPCRVSSLLKRLHEMHEDVFGERETVSRALQDLMVGAQYAGHRYLCEGIVRAMKDMSCLDGITKLLYPDIAAKFGSTAEQVERNIRSAIQRAWDSGGAEVMRRMFGYVPVKKRPTNAEFIAVVADRLLQKQATTPWNRANDI